MPQWLIRGARITDPSQGLENEPLDLLVRDGVIADFGRSLSADAREIRADGCLLLPGLVDAHVHLRDPGQTHKEDIESGCRAAAAGGVTSVACMPNTSPACDCPDVVRQIRDKAKDAAARVYPVAAVTASLAGEQMTDFAALKAAGAVAVSDDGRPVPTGAMMKRALEEAASAGLPLLSHSEDLSIAAGGIMHEGSVSRSLGVPGIHPAAEEAATAREIALAAATGCPVHICHVSTKGSVELLRDARRRGVPVTGETAPHYIALTDAQLLSRDADYRMNPPLRSEQDVAAVLQGLKDGTLTVIATDHAPHAPEEKADFVKAPNGAVGLEPSLAVCYTKLVVPGLLTLSELVTLMAWNPARLLRVPGGTLQKGAPADLILFDPAAHWTVRPDKLHGKSRNTPFKGMALTGKVRFTMLGGRVVFAEGAASWTS